MNNTPKPPKYQINETRDIHPLVALWLTKNGYSYIHEYKLPDYGRVDFFATHSDGHKLLVEAKVYDLHKVITQLAGYGVQMPEARLSIAAPLSAITDKIRGIAKKYGIGVIETPEIERSNDNSDGVGRIDADTMMLSILANRAENTHLIIYSSQQIVSNVIEWHEERESTPLLDFFVLYHCVNQSDPDIYPDAAINFACDVYLEMILSFLDAYPKEYLQAVMDLFMHTKALATLPHLSGNKKWTK